MTAVAEVRKALVALVGVGGPLGAAVADPNPATVSAAVVAVLVVFGVYKVPNSSAPTSGTLPRSGALRKRPRHAGRGI